MILLEHSTGNEIESDTWVLTAEDENYFKARQVLFGRSIIGRGCIKRKWIIQKLRKESRSTNATITFVIPQTQLSNSYFQLEVNKYNRYSKSEANVRPDVIE